MGAKGITLRVRKFNEVRGTGKSRDQWLRQYTNQKNAGVVGLFKDGKEVMTYLGASDEGGVRVRTSEVANNADTLVYLTNNQWTGPQMLKDMKTLVDKSSAQTLVYRNQDGSEYILHIKNGADRKAISDRLQAESRILAKNNLATLRGKNKAINDALKPKASGPNKGKYVFTVRSKSKGVSEKKVVFNSQPSKQQLEALWRKRIAGQTTRAFKKESTDKRQSWSDAGFVLYKSKRAN